MITTNNKGFTLIELLVVISIIALLSSIILSAVKDARDKAEVRAFEQDLVQIRNAIQIYREQNNGSWPPSFYANIINRNTNNSVSIQNVLLPELYAAGVYNSDTINLPSFISPPVVIVGQKNTNSTGNYHSCNTEENNEFAIVFRNISGTTPVQHASFDPRGYWSSSSGQWTIYDGIDNIYYFYCLNIK